MKRSLIFALSLLFIATLGACGTQQEQPTTVTTSATTEASVTEPPTTTQPKPTILPVKENWQSWLDGYPVIKEPAKNYDEIKARFGAIHRGFTAAGVHYLIYDMDGDHIPELFMSLEPVMEVHWFVYTMQNNQAHYVGSFTGNWGGSRLTSCPKGGVYVDGSHMELAWRYLVTKQGNSLKTKEIYHIDYISTNAPFPGQDPNSVALNGQGLEYYY